MIISRAHALYFPNDCDSTSPNAEEDDVCAYSGGTKYVIHVPVDGLPPTVEWNTTTAAEFLELPLGLSGFIMQHYQSMTPLIVQTEYTGNCCETVRCHPGYREGAPWYDWVAVADHDDNCSDVIPFKVLAVVPLRDVGNDVTRYELVGVAGTTRTECDSVLFTEWNVSLDYSVIRAETIIRRSFAIKVSPKVVSIVCPQNEWAYHFAH
jgi:hypothetical protein